MSRHPAPPNIIVVMTDDQGYGDLSCMGNSAVHTPHLDHLAASGALLTSWYASAPVCSPSRASLLTGRYPGNAGVRSILAGHRTATGLPAEVPTLATALQAIGYRTAMVGKWHLGVAAGSRPSDHGFADWFGCLAGCVDYYSHIFYWGMNQGGPANNPLHDLWHNDQEVYHNGRYLTELITERALAVVHQPHDAPFLLYVAYNAPHYPLHAPQAYLDRFPHLPWDRQIMAAMLSALDDGIGAILDALEQRGLRHNTLVFFQSDNGPSRESRNWLDGRQDPYYGGTTGLLKGHKYSLYEGGIRVPAIVSWPARIPPGQVIDEVGTAMDLFPTCLKAAGGAPTRYAVDGMDVLPMVADGAPSPHHELFWEMEQQTAMRRGPWKLVLNGQVVEGAPAEDAIHLANLHDDLAERHNLRDQLPALAAELADAATAWRARIETRWQQEWLPRMGGTTTHAGTERTISPQERDRAGR